MYNFVNSFRLATNEQCSEVIVSFSQAFPDDSGELQPLPVSDLIMPGPLAFELATKIAELFNDSASKEDTPAAAEKEGDAKSAE
ncbi:MAG: hypothetical protein LUE89_08970 [Clostridiales bacterium]|nr:hypothetical protein [Clostridiales bacterium]